MKNLVALILGVFSFLCLFISLNHVVIVLDAIVNLWAIVLTVVYIVANYVAFFVPSFATTLFQNSRWPLLFLYAFIAAFVSVYVFVDMSNYGFSLFTLLAFGPTVAMAALSFGKCISSGSSHRMDLNVLQLRSAAEGWSAEMFLSARASLEAAHRKETFVGCVAYFLSICFSLLVFCLEWIFIYQ